MMLFVHVIDYRALDGRGVSVADEGGEHKGQEREEEDAGSQHTMTSRLCLYCEQTEGNSTTSSTLPISCLFLRVPHKIESRLRKAIPPVCVSCFLQSDTNALA